MGLLAMLSACGEEKQENPNSIFNPNNQNNANNTNNTNNLTDMGGDADDMPDMAWPTDVIGQVTVSYWQPDALFAYPELQSHAVFSSTLAQANLVNPVGWLAASEGWDVFIPDDYWHIPTLGESADTDMPPMDIDEYRLLNAGDFVVIGQEVVANLDEELFESQMATVYASNQEYAREWAEEEDLSGPIPLEIEGGANLAGSVTDQAFLMPAPIAFTSHDPAQPLGLRYGQDVVVQWTPSPEDDLMLVTIETFDSARVWQTEDDGEIDLTQLAADAQIALGDEPTFSFSRILPQQVATPAGVVNVNAMRKVWLYGQRVAPYTIEPKVWEVGKSTAVRVSYADGTFNNPTVDAGPNTTVQQVMLGDTEGRVVEFQVDIAADAQTGPVELTITDGSGTPSITLKDQIYIAAALPSAGDCPSSVDEGVLPDGAYFATDAGLDFGQFVTDFCPAGDPTGREQTIPIALQTGERLTATLVGDAPGAMYLVQDCDDLNDVDACSHSPAQGRPTQLEYWAPRDETLLLVVDSYALDDSPAANYVVNIKRDAPTIFQFDPPILTEGGTELLQFIAFGGDFTSASPFSFGAGITIDQVDVFGNYAEVTVTAGLGLTDSSIDVTAEVAGVASTIPDSLYVAPYIASPNTCMAADTAGALGPGSYEGATLLGSTDAVSPVPCLSQNADGMEGIFRVDLGPSETLRAQVIMPGRDPVLYVMESCDAAVLACSDNTSVDQAEYVEWTGSATGSTVYLVVDGFDVDDSDVFYLDLDISL